LAVLSAERLNEKVFKKLNVMKIYNWSIIDSGFMAQKMAAALLLVPQSKLYAVASRRMSIEADFAAMHNCKAYGSCVFSHITNKNRTFVCCNNPYS
jgi:hypothetical protein